MNKDLKFLEEKKIVFYSVDITIPLTSAGTYAMHSKYSDRIKKAPKGLPSYKNIKVTTKCDSTKNGSVIFLGDVYNLIGIDIDNKGDTIDKYYAMLENNNIEPTLTTQTCNNGYHEYYRLTNEQKEKLKDFTSVNGTDKDNNMFGLNIDIKYNNQLFFGPSVFGNKKEFKYEFYNAIEPIILPELLYKEIIKNCKTNHKKEVKIITKEKNVTINIPQINEQNLPDIDYGFVNDQNLPNIDYGFINEQKKFEDIIDLVSILAIKRADNYEDWINLGFCLHNINDELLFIWDKFSKNSQKYEESVCKSKWSKMTHYGEHGLTIGTLHFWAKNDNPFEYEKYKKKYLKLNIAYNGTHDKIAEIFYKLNQDVLTCARETPNPLWYILECGVWKSIEGTSTIRRMIKDQINPLYKEQLQILSNKVEELEKLNDPSKLIEINKINKDIKLVAKTVNNLETNGFITSLLVQIQQYFKKDKFLEQLDNNPDILCFGKDLYDLKTNTWRETLPTDMCSLTCGVSKDDITNNNLDLLMKILLDIFTTKERLQYMINTFSTYLCGRNKVQKFYIWMGVGANGKSFLEFLFLHSFGDYCKILKPLLITQKETSADAASEELFKVKGIRIGFFPEPDQKSKANNSLLKSWSGGETISCRKLFSSPIEFNVYMKIIILCNKKFQLQDTCDNSIKRRTEYTDFKTKFEYEPNPNKTNEKLRNDEYMSEDFLNSIKGAFMCLLIDTYKKLQSTNFKYDIPKDIINDRDNFIDENNEVKSFLKACCIKGNEKDYITLKSLYAHYVTYSKRNCIEITTNITDFKERIINEEKYIFKDKFQPTIDGKQCCFRAVFTNIKFVEDDDDKSND